MAKFCTKCGAETVDGKCPKCKVEKTTKTAPVESSSFDIKECFMDCLNVLKKIFTKPVEAIADFVKENKFVSGIILMVFTAIASGLSHISMLKNSGASMDMSLEDILTSAFSGGSSVNYFKEFLITFLREAGYLAALVFVGWLIVAKLFKGKTSIKEMVNIVGMAVILICAANLINSLLYFLDGEFIAYVIKYINLVATGFMYLIILGGVEKTSEIKKEQLYLSVITVVLAGTICLDILAKIIK